MDQLKDVIDTCSGFIWNTPKEMPFMVVLLLFTGLFLTVRMGLLQLRKLGHSIKAIMGRYDDPSHQGDVSHFQALASAVSATVGIGNIAGVATAIHYGGPGSLFWLWLTGFIGMASKFTECTLSMKYRVVHGDGSVSGGPMYYIEKGLGPRFKWLALLFATCAVISSFGSGNAVQAFTMADSFRADFGIPTWVSGLVSATIVGTVIIGGIRRIGRVASILTPFMGSFYVLGALTVLVLNADKIPDAIQEIVSNAFNPPGMVGGFAGSAFIFTLTWGVKRGLFSNEAGQGSAPIAHAAARTNEPVREGAVALMEPFIDTVVICFMTGLVIVTTGVWKEKFPDRVAFLPKSGITVVKPGSTVKPTGIVGDADLFEGRAQIVRGVLKGAALVRNHSVMDDARVMVHGQPFTGVIEVHQGKVTFYDEQGRKLSNFLVFVEGKTLLNGSPLTAQAFRLGLAPLIPFGNFIVTIAVFLFAISTAISWSYYGDRAVTYLFGQRGVMPYRIVFTVVHFLASIFSLEVVWGFGDVALGLMAIPNLFTILFLSREVARDSRDYFARMKELELRRG